MSCQVTYIDINQYQSISIHEKTGSFSDLVLGSVGTERERERERERLYIYFSVALEECM